MNIKTLESLSNRLIAISKETRDVTEIGDRKTKIIGSEGVTFTLVDDYADEFEFLIESLLLKEGWSDKYSYKFLEKSIQSIIGKQLRNKSSSVKQSVIDLEKAYETYNTKHLVYIPLVGIEMKKEEFHLGEVILKMMNQSLLSNIQDKIETILQKSRTDDETKKAATIHQNHILQSLLGKTCAEYSVIAEPVRSRERALEATRRVIDLIRFTIPAAYPKDFGVTVGIDGSIPGRSTLVTPTIASDGSKYSIGMSKTGPFSPFIINDKTTKIMDNIGVLSASKILQKPLKKVTNFEESILRGLHWFANSVTQIEEENSFLNKITCIETFLTPRDGNPIGTAIAEGVAMILGKDLDSRKRLKRRMKILFGKRSGISHGGKKIILETDLNEINEIAGSISVWMINNKNKFDSTKSLLEWLEDRKFE